MDADGSLAWNDLIRQASARLALSLGGDRTHEARWIVERVSDYTSTELVVHGTEFVSARAVAFFDSLLERRCTGEPLQYVLGRWSFRTLELHITPDVLIPRPETEYVTEYAVRAAKDVYAYGRSPVVVDLGTGSGAIGLSVAVEVKASQIWATDVSPRALAVARANLAGLGRAALRVTLVEGSWFDALPRDLAGDIDVLVSNPPYVAIAADLPDDVRNYEPHLALFAEDDGYAFVGLLIDGAPVWLRPGGALVLEMAETQTTRAVEHATRVGLVDSEVIIDLTGRPRGIVCRRPGVADS